MPFVRLPFFFKDFGVWWGQKKLVLLEFLLAFFSRESLDVLHLTFLVKFMLEAFLSFAWAVHGTSGAYLPHSVSPPHSGDFAIGAPLCPLRGETPSNIVKRYFSGNYFRNNFVSKRTDVVIILFIV